MRLFFVSLSKEHENADWMFAAPPRHWLVAQRTCSLFSSASLLTMELAFSMVQMATFTPSMSLPSSLSPPWYACTFSYSEKQTKRDVVYGGVKSRSSSQHHARQTGLKAERDRVSALTSAPRLQLPTPLL